MNNPGVRVRERIDKNHGDTVEEDIILPQKNVPYTAARSERRCLSRYAFRLRASPYAQDDTREGGSNRNETATPLQTRGIFAPHTAAAREFVILPIYINEKICNKNE